MRKPNLNSLRMFDAAARHGNFRAAAEELNLTQGAVAQQVRKLEADIEQSLFTRLPRGLALTETGTHFHKDIRKALGLIDRATENLTPDSALVTLSVPPSVASKWLVPRLADFAIAFPHITLDMRASEALTDFRRDDVDLAIRQGLMPKGAGSTKHLLAPLDLCAVASPAYATHHAAVRGPQCFAAHKLIQDGHRHWTQLFETHDMPLPTNALSFNQTALAIDAAISGQGVALAPRLLAGDALETGQLVELWQAPNTNEAYYLLHPPQVHPARDKVIGWLLDQT